MLKPIPTVNFQSQKTSAKMISIVAYINYGFTDLKNVPQRKMTLLYDDNGEELCDQYDTVNVNEKIYVPARVSTGITMPKTFWDNKTKTSTDNHINEQLIQFTSSVEKLYAGLLQISNNITPEYLEKEITKHVLKKEDKLYVQTFADKVIDKITAPQLEITSPLFIDFVLGQIEIDVALKDISEKTSIHYKIFVAHLKQYCKEKNQTIYAHQLTNELFEDYFIWLRKTFIIAEETINKDKKIFKKYAFRAKEKFKLENLNISNNKRLRRKSLRKSQRKPIIYLNVAELRLLEALTSEQLAGLAPELSKEKELFEYTRDYFLLAAWNGGKRISDYRDKEYYLNERKDKPGSYYLEDFSIKTGNYTKLGCFPIAAKIWKKYNGKMPKVPSQFNKIIKKICRLAGITELVVVDRTGKRKEKCLLITSHTARRSFCSNMVYEFNQNYKNVMRWAGLDSIEVLESSYLGEDNRTDLTEWDEMLETYNKK